MSPTPPRRIFITVAEVSGDQHAAHLVRSLKQLDPTLIIEGLGGPEMRGAGAVIHYETVKSAAMVFRQYGARRKCFDFCGGRETISRQIDRTFISAAIHGE